MGNRDRYTWLILVWWGHFLLLIMSLMCTTADYPSKIYGWKYASLLRPEQQYLKSSYLLLRVTKMAVYGGCTFEHFLGQVLGWLEVHKVGHWEILSYNGTTKKAVVKLPHANVFDATTVFEIVSFIPSRPRHHSFYCETFKWPHSTSDMGGCQNWRPKWWSTFPVFGRTSGSAVMDCHKHGSS